MESLAVVQSASDIASWVCEHVDDDPHHVARVVTSHTHRWGDIDDDALAALTADCVSTGDARWDALIEGSVAFVLRRRRMKRPEWTKRTVLEEGFDPYDDIHRDVRVLLNTGVFRTPGELLNKGVIFSRDNFVRV